MKKIYTLAVVIVLIALFANTTAFACSPSSKVKITINKKTVRYDASPYLSKGEVMIPVEETAEALGAEFEWDKKNNTAWLHFNMSHAKLIVGKSEFYIHRDADFSGIPETVKLNTSIKYSRGNVYVPGNTVLESLGMSVAWDSKKKVLSISNESSSDSITYTELSVDDISNIKEVQSWYNKNYTKAGIHSMRYKGWMYVLASAGERPTGGYTLSIDNLFYSSADTVIMNAKVTPPGDNVRVIMMITYPSILIRIKSDTLTTIIGEVSDTKINEVTLAQGNVKAMELYDLNGVKQKDITGSEKDEIINSFNQAVIDPNPYIEMITGKLLKVTTTDGYLITFSSYGSETNLIASLQKDGNTKTYHLTTPGIAKYIYK